MPPGKRPVPPRNRVQEAEKRQRDTGPIIYPRGTPPPLGTTSRAYANARGSQKDLGVPNSNFATQGQGNPLFDALATTSNIGSRGGSAAAESTLLSPGLTIADLSKNPYGPAYDKLLQFIADSAKSRGPDYENTATQLKTIRAKADEDLHASYLDNRKAADASATALGVDPNAVASQRDFSNRRMQENSDQALADNLAWVQKAKLLQGDNLQGFLAQAAAAKASSSSQWDAEEQIRVAELNMANLQAAASARNGGGGGGGGGGSKSGSSKVGVTKTDTLVNSGLDLEAYNYLVNSGQTDAAAAFLNQANINSGNPMVADTQKKVNNLAATPKPKWNSKFGKQGKNLLDLVNFAKTQKQKKIMEQVLKQAMGYSGVLGNPKTSTVVKTTGKAS